MRVTKLICHGAIAVMLALQGCGNNASGNPPARNSHPDFIEMADTAPSETPLWALKQALGEPTYIVTVPQMVETLSDEPLSRDNYEYFKLIREDSEGDSISRVSLDRTFKDYMRFSIWKHHLPRDGSDQYDHAWYESEDIRQLDVYIYSERDIFPEESKLSLAWLFFVRDDKVVMKSSMRGWANLPFVHDDLGDETEEES